jgi:Ca-activated chloride channel family protein
MPNEGNQMDATVRLEHSVLAVEEEHELHAMVELAVPALREEATRPPLRVALVVDRSGSMHGAKLSAAKRCAQWIAERLQAKDELGLVAFDDRVRLLTRLHPLTGHVCARRLRRSDPAARRTSPGAGCAGSGSSSTPPRTGRGRSCS